MELNKVHNINFLNNSLPDKCAGLIIADPPYFEVKGDFDFIWNSFDDYLKDVEKWAAECKRLLADNGTLLWWGHAKKIAYSQVIIDRHFELINNCVWEKVDCITRMYIQNFRTFAPVTERMLVYTNDTINLTGCVFYIRDYIRAEIIKSKGKIIFKDVNSALGTATNGGGVASACLSLDKAEPAMITKEMYERLQSWCAPFLSKSYENLRSEFDKLRADYESERRRFDNYLNLTDVLKFEQEARSYKHTDHDTMKPETLTRALILTCSRPSDLVVVPFAGSGTECAMAIKEGRQAIGFDIESKYVDMANTRILRIQQQPQLFTA